MNKIIYFDVDDTLFSKKIFAKSMANQISVKTKLSDEKVIEMENAYLSTLKSSTDFHPSNLMKYISETTGTDYNELMGLLDNKEIFEKALFPETKTVLEKLKNNYKIGVYSEGFEDFQMKKITLSGIIDYVDRDLIIIGRRKLDKENINQIKHGSTVIEDKPEVVEVLKNNKNFKTVWINRNNARPIEGVKTVKDLREII